MATLDIGPLAGELLLASLLSALGAAGPQTVQLTLITNGGRPLAEIAPPGRLLDDTARATVLSALEDASDYRRDQGEHCSGCVAEQASTGDLGALCGDHATDNAIAAMYDLLHEQLQAQS